MIGSPINIKLPFCDERKKIIMENKIWQETTFIELCNYYKDERSVQYKFPQVDVWVDLDMKKATIIAFIVLNQMNALWRVKLK